MAPAQVRLVCANALHRMLRPAGAFRRLLDDPRWWSSSRGACPVTTRRIPRRSPISARRPSTATPWRFSRHVTDADLTVYVNTNYIRGFTGGWKSVCIGLSTWKSIRVTHDPGGMSMSLERNRMHGVLDEMGRHLEGRLGRRVFKIDTLLADPFQAAEVFAGGVDETPARRPRGAGRGAFPRGAPPLPEHVRHPRLRGARLEPRTRSGHR